MKSTDIPNGFVYLGKLGNNVLSDFDDNGKVIGESQMVAINGWPESIIEKGMLKRDLIVLVHSVKGTDGMLVKRLATVKLEMDGIPTTVKEVSRLGKLKDTVERIWREYMAESKKKDQGK